MAEVLIKGQQPPSRWVYASAVGALAARFETQLAAADTQGCMILDARTKTKNTPSVHRITTSRFKSGGDRLPHLIESPTFGHSDAHVVLQIADLVASAVLFPMACAAYCGLPDPQPAPKRRVRGSPNEIRIAAPPARTLRRPKRQVVRRGEGDRLPQPYADAPVVRGRVVRPHHGRCVSGAKLAGYLTAAESVTTMSSSHPKLTLGRWWTHMDLYGHIPAVHS
jgi:hypothetical protein